MMKTMKTLSTRSALVRPTSTAERAIGSERKRSTRPFCRSSASPIEVVPIENATVWVKIPAIRNSL